MMDTSDLVIEGNFLDSKALGVTDEVRCALIKTLAAMEAGRIKHTTDRLGILGPASPEAKEWSFNMRNWASSYSRCGTVCCIGGSAEMMMGSVGTGRSLEFRLGAARNQRLSNLFGITMGSPYNYMGNVTDKQGAQALRNFLETGHANWTKVLGADHAAIRRGGAV